MSKAIPVEYIQEQIVELGKQVSQYAKEGSMKWREAAQEKVILEKLIDKWEKGEEYEID